MRLFHSHGPRTALLVSACSFLMVAGSCLGTSMGAGREWQGPHGTAPVPAAGSSAAEAFSLLKSRTLGEGEWDSVLGAVEAIVREHPSDPERLTGAIELMGSLWPEVPAQEMPMLAGPWTDFGLEFCSRIVIDPATNGTGKTPEGIRAATAVRELARVLEPAAARRVAPIWLAAGRIGRNLHANPSYPREAVPGLAPLLVAEAHGHLAADAGEVALSAIRTALDWGFTDFEEALDDFQAAGEPGRQAIREALESRQREYAARISPGIRNAIATFRPWEFSFSLPSLGGGQVNKTHYSGKLTVVDVWGTWCAPCRASLPHLKRLHREFAPRGVRVVGIAMEPGDSVDEVRTNLKAFATRNGIPYDLLIGNDSVMEQIPGGSLPTLVFLDEQGKVRFSISGYRDYCQIREITEQLLASPPTAPR